MPNLIPSSLPSLPSQLWLNEGFASICGSLFAPAMLLPGTRAREAFIASEVWGALAADSRRTSHPIEVPIEDPTKVNDIFDAITYKKGASVLAMIAGWVRSWLLFSSRSARS